MDISKEFLNAGKQFVREKGLDHKFPTLIQNTDLSFKELEGEKFDFILAHSVFTHMPLSDIDQCLRNIKAIMKNDSVFFATFKESEKVRGGKYRLTFFYPFSVMKELCQKHCLKVEKVDYKHPAGQKMLKITPLPFS